MMSSTFIAKPACLRIASSICSKPDDPIQGLLPQSFLSYNTSTTTDRQRQPSAIPSLLSVVINYMKFSLSEHEDAQHYHHHHIYFSAEH